MASNQWTWMEGKMFERFLVQIPEETPDRWEIIANHLLKPVAEVKEHYEFLVFDVWKIQSGLVDDHVSDYKDDECESSKQGYLLRSKHGGTKRKRGDKWTAEEHKLFLQGLKTYGPGDWRAISRYLVKTRTPQQVASHAQKYSIRLNQKETKRPSIHDITLDTDEAVTGTNMDMAGQNESPVQGQPDQ